MKKLERPEYLLLAAVLMLLAAGLFGPFAAQPAHQHDFADQRVCGAIPYAVDVLSNLPFALWGVAGLGCVTALFRQKGLQKHSIGGAQATVELGLAALFFVGLLATAAASSWYHWMPNNNTLAVDRLGMVIAFAGLLGLSATGRISWRTGLGLGCTVLVFGALSVRVWLLEGNILPWLLTQFGGMAMVLWFACLKPLPGTLPVRWGLVIMVYAVAKLLELGDHPIYEWTSHAVSGHSLKHAVASFAAWPVLAALSVWMKSDAEITQPENTWIAKLQRHKTSAESPATVQRVPSRPLPGQLRATQGLRAFKTNQNRSQA